MSPATGRNSTGRELKREKRQATLLLSPLLLAEMDLIYLKKCRESREIEAQLMADVPGWRVGESVFHTKSYVPDRFFLTTLSK